MIMNSSCQILSVLITKDQRNEIYRYEVPILVRQSNKERMEQSGGIYKDALTYLILERSMTFDRRIRFFVNQDIAKIMRRIV